jgi:hypothetical protein
MAAHAEALVSAHHQFALDYAMIDVQTAAAQEGSYAAHQ